MTSSMGGYGGMVGPTGNVGNKTPSGTRVGQIAQYTPQQMDLLERSFGQVSPDSYLSRLAGGDQNIFNEIEAPALHQFSELQGGLASRFSAGGGGRGAMSSRNSSGFQNASGKLSSNFAQELQAQRQSLQRQAVQDLRGITQDLLGYRPYQSFSYEKKKKPGFDWGGAGGAVLGGIGGFFAGNPIGGAALGYSVGSGLTGGGGSGGGTSGYGNFGNFSNPFGGGGDQNLASSYDRQFRQEGLSMY